MERASIPNCDCPDCNSHTVADCINYGCFCCGLEDAFKIIEGKDETGRAFG